MSRRHYPLAAALLLTAGTVMALPQSVTGVAYPQEVYYTRDLRFYAPTTLFDLLRQIPGVTLGYQADGQAEIQLHGIDGRYLSILINGQPLLASGGNNVLTTRQIPATLVHHIEIDRNARSDLYAGGGASGTINVILNDAYQNDGVLVSAGGTSLNNRIAAAAHLLNGDTPLRIAGEQRLQREAARGETESQTSDGHWHAFDRELSRDLLLSFDTRIQDQHPLSLYAMQLKGDAEQRLSGSYPLNRPTTERSPNISPADTEREYRRTTQRLGGELTLNWSHLALNSWLQAEQSDQSMALSQNLPVPARQATQMDDSRYVAGWSLQETVDEHRWKVGVSLEQSKRVHESESDAVITSNSDRSGLPYSYDIKQNKVSVQVLDRWHLTPATEFETGFVADSYEISLNPDSSDRSDVATDTHWLPSFHFLHRLAPGKRLRLSASQSAREPDLSDRVPYEFVQDNTIWRGNENLDPELISNIDVGYEQNFSRPASALSDRNSGFYLRLFQRTISNAIYQGMTAETNSSLTTYTVLQPVNAVGSAVLRGAELDLEFYLPGQQDIRLDVGAGAYRSSIQEDGDLKNHYRLTNQPDYMARLGFHHQPLPGVRYGAHWHLQGPSEQLLPGESGYLVQETSAMQMLDLYTEYQWTPSWHILLTARLQPGATPWQEQTSTRQYRDIDPQWQLVLMGLF